jgi:hypothetical protein
MKNINKKIAIVSTLVFGSITASYAEGSAADAATTIASNVDFSSVTSAIGIIGGALGALYLGIKGAKVVLSMIKGG